MRCLHTLFMFIPFLCLLGCAAPLTTETADANKRRELGLPEDDALFLSYCDFGETRPNQERFVVISGVLFLTSDELLLLGGDLDDVEKRVKLIIPIADMQGVALHHHGLGRQIQIAMDGRLLLIGITKNRFTVDRDRSQAFVDHLLALGVAERKSEKLYLPATGSLPFIIPIWLLLPGPM